MAEENEVVVRVGPSGYRAEVSADGHTLVVDEPAAAGGTSAGPTPYAYLAAALGACTAMTVRMFADRRGWPLEGVTVRLRHDRTHEKDCADCATDRVGVDRFVREVELEGALTDEQREALLRIADRCPVQQTFDRGIRVVAADALPGGSAAA